MFKEGSIYRNEAGRDLDIYIRHSTETEDGSDVLVYFIYRSNREIQSEDTFFIPKESYNYWKEIE